MSFAAVIERLQKLENPYPGLRPFETQESHLFFGRDQQVAELVGRLERHRFLAVVGVSGSGKSSLVRAGLIPALERGRVLEAGRRWRMVITRPGGAPFERIGADLAHAGLETSRLRETSLGLVETARQLPQEESLLVVVDQFEELFRYKGLQPITGEAKRRHAAAASEAAEFVQLLLAAARGYPSVYIVLTMRSDYLGDCAEFRDLPETLNDCQYLVPRMTREQRKQAIEGPLGQVKIAASVVQRMLNDAGDEPDQLPVLQHALMRTWNRWRESDPQRTRPIERQDYEAVGGFEDALNQHADELLAGVPQEVAEAIFKRLTARGPGNRERRDPARLAEVWAVCGAVTAEQRARVTAVIDHFRSGDATFLSPLAGAIGPDTYIDITHESLIRQWKTLRDGWLPEEQLAAKTFLEVAARARNWKNNRGELLAGLDLTAVAEWDRRRNKTTAWAEHYADEAGLREVVEFVAASQANERRRVIRKRTWWSAAVLLVVGIAGVSVTWWLERVEAGAALARAEAEIADTQTLLAQTVLANASRRDGDSQGDAPDSAEGPNAAPAPVSPPTGGPASPPLPTSPPPPASRPSTTGPLKPRIYIQVRSQTDADAVRWAMNGTLQQAGFVVPSAEVLKVGPKSTQVRFFRREEQAGADQIVRLLRPAVIGDVEPQYVPGRENSLTLRPGHFEVWLAPGALLAGVVLQLNDASAEVRKSVGAQLARNYGANPIAIGLVLDTLSEQNLPSLSVEGRINALYFLNRSDSAAWNDEHKKLARGAIERMRARASSGAAAAGPQTVQELDQLEKKVAG